MPPTVSANAPNHESASLGRAMEDASEVERDLDTLCKFVQGKLFVHVIHDMKSEDNQMSDKGILFQQFVRFFKSRENRSKITNKHIQGANDVDLKAYLKHIWNKGNISSYISAEKSSVYAAIYHYFQKMITDCLMNGIPIPAYETFERKTTLPRRYFFFFETFIQAGRHNKEAWTKGLNAVEKWGEEHVIAGTNPPRKAKTILFHRVSTCLLEAHVLTTIQENYFLWIFQCLINTSAFGSSWNEKINDFITEYEIDWDNGDWNCTDLYCGSTSEGVSNTLPSHVALAYEGPAEFPEDSTSTSSDEEEGDEEGSHSTPSPVFSIVKESTEGEELKYKRERRREFAALKEVLVECSAGHKERLAWMREWIPKLRSWTRDDAENVTEERVNEVMAASKVILKQLTDVCENAIQAFEEGKFQKGREKERPKKKQKMDSNKTKQSDAKLQVFMEKKRELDIKEALGITLAAERIYKELKKKHLGKDKELETKEKRQPVVMESDEWMNQITHVGLV